MCKSTSMIIDKDGKLIENPRLTKNEKNPYRCVCDPLKPKHSTHRDRGGFLVCSDCGGRIY